jgi:hypothetical protein
MKKLKYQHSNKLCPEKLKLHLILDKESSISILSAKYGVLLLSSNQREGQADEGIYELCYYHLYDMN